MIQLQVKSLGEVPENIRPYCTESNGVVTFDETQMRTVQDVENMKAAKDREVSEHNKVKVELAAFKSLKKTPEELQDIVIEYPSLKEGGKTQEDYLAEKKAHNSTQKKLEKAEADLAASQTERDELKALKVKAQKGEKWKELRGKLSETYDPVKLDTLFEDIEDKLQLDEIGEFAPYKDKSVKDYITSRAELWGLHKNITPGKSRPGTEKAPAGAQGQSQPIGGTEYIDDDLAAQLG